MDTDEFVRRFSEAGGTAEQLHAFIEGLTTGAAFMEIVREDVFVDDDMPEAARAVLREWTSALRSESDG